MGLRLHVDGDRVRGDITFDRRHEGAPGIAHGGAIATVLDDTLGLLLVVLGTPAVTANLSINYKAPVLLRQPLHVIGWCTERRGRKLFFQARLESEGTTIADATALFLAVDTSHFHQGGQQLPPEWADWSPATAPDRQQTTARPHPISFSPRRTEPPRGWWRV
ncbi:PaaI family thioesterase [Patulibacter medicamentivorans]|uniref:PaaI family thioesterase n=1 Tax=Patulibacter medicamentivorans TaxID=1097667 RepID=UPI0009D9AFF5|nr:PaaI family thioesterase [Patulibacter medicamentivorans]